MNTAQKLWKELEGQAHLPFLSSIKWQKDSGQLEGYLKALDDVDKIIDNPKWCYSEQISKIKELRG